MNLLKNVNFWGILVGIIGIIYGIFSNLNSYSAIEPVYILDTYPTIIYNSENPSKNIKVIIGDSSSIHKSIFSKNIKLWNHGNTAISEDYLRLPIEIVGINNAKLIDLNIVRESHPNISNFHIERNDSSGVITWDYFDPKFYVEIQVIYSGDWQSDIAVQGYVLGNAVKQVKPRIKRSTSQKQFAIVVIVLIFILIIYTFGKFIESLNKGKISDAYLFIFNAIIFISFSIYFIFEIFIWNYEIPI